MFGFSRKTRGQLMREELGTSWEHFLQAATHAANGMGSTIGPQATKVRGMATRGWDSTSHALAPLAMAYREGAADAQHEALKLAKRSKNHKKGKQMSNKKMGMLIGLLAAGAVVGAAGALVMKRRKQQQWSEYDPSNTLDPVSPDARSVIDKATSKANQTANKAMDRAADKLESTASSMRNSELKSKLEESAARTGEATDELSSKYSSAKHNSRS